MFLKYFYDNIFNFIITEAEYFPKMLLRHVLIFLHVINCVNTFLFISWTDCLLQLEFIVSVVSYLYTDDIPE